MDDQCPQVSHVPRGIQLRGSLLLLTIIAAIGCGNTSVPQTSKFIPPDSFANQNSKWKRDVNGPTETDNHRIGRFFQTKPGLLDSPEWHGEPAKYVEEGSSNRTRYYWFSGTAELPTWNVVEFNGSRLRDFAGQGLPGTIDSPSNDSN